MLFLPVWTYAQARQHLLPLSPEERTALNKRLDPALMPAGAGEPQVDIKQVFNLVSSEITELTVVPVVFTLCTPNTGVQGFTCGAYLLPAHGPAYFLDGSPKDSPPVQCWKILAVRLARKEQSRQRSSLREQTH